MIPVIGHHDVLPGTMDQHLHIFCSCPDLKLFRSQVCDLMFKLKDIQLGDNPASWLIHLAPLSSKCYKWSITIFLLNTAKACIPLYWQQSIPPPWLKSFAFSFSFLFCKMYLGQWLPKSSRHYNVLDGPFPFISKVITVWRQHCCSGLTPPSKPTSIKFYLVPTCLCIPFCWFIILSVGFLHMLCLFLFLLIHL